MSSSENMGMLAKLRAAATATAIFLLIFAAVYFIHARYFPVDVVLYAALADLVLALALTLLLVFRTRWFAVLGGFERAQLAVVWLLGGTLVSFAVPTLIDRSFSFYILEKLQQRGGGILADRIEQVIFDEFIEEHRLMDVRLTEQLVSGTVVIESGCVLLTPRGQRLASFGRWFRTQVLPRQRLLMGSYSADLTDPFRHAAPDVSIDYSCGSDPLPAR
jgi:hypothetical protein